jgi:hypothetical protein
VCLIQVSLACTVSKYTFLQSASCLYIASQEGHLEVVRLLYDRCGKELLMTLTKVKIQSYILACTNYMHVYVCEDYILEGPERECLKKYLNINF